MLTIEFPQAAGRKVIVLFHIPALVRGREEVEAMKSLHRILMSDSCVRLVLCGHEHNYQRYTKEEFARFVVDAARLAKSPIGLLAAKLDTASRIERNGVNFVVREDLLQMVFGGMADQDRRQDVPIVRRDRQISRTFKEGVVETRPGTIETPAAHATSQHQHHTAASVVGAKG